MSHCRIDDCATSTVRGRAVCERHRTRIRRHGDPHFTHWTVADETDVDLIARDPRPVEGLTRLERVMVARRLHGQISGDEIARVVGVTPRTVWRWAAEGFKQAA
jgi:hypothetical protein